MGIEERRFGQHRRTSEDQKLCRDLKLQVMSVAMGLDKRGRIPTLHSQKLHWNSKSLWCLVIPERNEGRVRLPTQDITKSINPTFLKTPGGGWRLFASRIGLFSEGLKEVLAIPVVVGWAWIHTAIDNSPDQVRVAIEIPWKARVKLQSHHSKSETNVWLKSIK